MWLPEASSLFSRKNSGLFYLLILQHNFKDMSAHLIARSARYSSPIDSKVPPRLLCVLSTMNAFRANSSPVMSLAICNFPLSPSGLAIEMCNTNVLIINFTIDVVLLVVNQLDSHVVAEITHQVRPYSPRLNLLTTSALTNDNFSVSSLMYRLEPPMPALGSTDFEKSIR